MAGDIFMQPRGGPTPLLAGSQRQSWRRIEGGRWSSGAQGRFQQMRYSARESLRRGNRQPRTVILTKISYSERGTRVARFHAR